MKKNVLIAAAAIGITAAAGTLIYRNRETIAPKAKTLKDRMVQMGYAMSNRAKDFFAKMRKERPAPQLVAAE